MIPMNIQHNSCVL